MFFLFSISRRRQKSENINENTPIVTNTTLNVLRSFGKNQTLCNNIIVYGIVVFCTCDLTT